MSGTVSVQEFKELTKLVLKTIESVNETAILTKNNAVAIRELAEVMREEDKEHNKLIHELREDRIHCQNNLRQLQMMVEQGFKSKREKIETIITTVDRKADMDRLQAIEKRLGKLESNAATADDLKDLKTHVNKVGWSIVLLMSSILGWAFKMIFENMKNGG